MSKFIPLALVGVALPAVAVGGYMLSNNMSVDYILEKDFEKFKKDGLNGCISGLFGEIGTIESASTSSEEADNSSNKIESTFLDGEGKVEGCLVVNWDKETQSNKGKGNFRFLWAMKKGGKGFVVFNTLTSSNSNTDKNLKGDGAAYLMENKNGVWSISKKKGVETDKKIANGDFDNKFPKAHAKLQDMTNQNHGKFVSGKDDLNNMCESEDACNNPTDSTGLRGYGKWKEDSGKENKASDWTSTFSTWWGEIYTTGVGDMENALTNIKGEGQSQHISGVDLSQAA